MTEVARQWGRRILGAFIQGSAHAGMAFLATAAGAPIGNAIGVQISVMDFKQLGAVMIGSGLLKLFGVLERLGSFMQDKAETGDVQQSTKQ